MSSLVAKYGSAYVRVHKPVARPTGLTLLQGRPYTPACKTDVTQAWRKKGP